MAGRVLAGMFVTTLARSELHTHLQRSLTSIVPQPLPQVHRGDGPALRPARPSPGLQCRQERRHEPHRAGKHCSVTIAVLISDKVRRHCCSGWEQTDLAGDDGRVRHRPARPHPPAVLAPHPGTMLAVLLNCRHSSGL